MSAPAKDVMRALVEQFQPGDSPRVLACCAAELAQMGVHLRCLILAYEDPDIGTRYLVGGNRYEVQATVRNVHEVNQAALRDMHAQMPTTTSQ